MPICDRIYSYVIKTDIGEIQLAQLKLFSSTGGARVAKRAGRAKQQKSKKPLKTLAIWLSVVLCLEGLYFFCVYTNNSFVKKWRTMYINTAMDTMTHQWLAEYFIPKDVIDEVRFEYGEKKSATVGVETSWGKQDTAPTTPDDTTDSNVTHIDANITHNPTTDETPAPEEQLAQDEEAFYELFWEIDRSSMEAYLAEYPDKLANGWDHIYINEAGFEDEGTSIRTIFDEQVLAIDAHNQILLLREEGKGWRGVLAVAKDPTRLSLEMAATVPVTGQLSGEIAEANNGVLAINANGFVDPEGGGNGGQVVGYAMSNGTAYGSHATAYAYKRIELHENNLLYVKDALSPVSEDCTDAAEFTPVLIVDGVKIMDDYWTGTQPRCALGQSDKYEILMLVIEGRNLLEGIVGTSVNTCSDILLQHNCMQGMALDGGTSAMMWFDGEYVIRSSNPNVRYTGGRTIPNAWVYHRAEN